MITSLALAFSLTKVVVLTAVVGEQQLDPQILGLTIAKTESRMYASREHRDARAEWDGGVVASQHEVPTAIVMAGDGDRLTLRLVTNRGLLVATAGGPESEAKTLAQSLFAPPKPSRGPAPLVVTSNFAGGVSVRAGRLRDDFGSPVALADECATPCRLAIEPGRNLLTVGGRAIDLDVPATGLEVNVHQRSRSLRGLGEGLAILGGSMLLLEGVIFVGVMGVKDCCKSNVITASTGPSMPGSSGGGDIPHGRVWAGVAGGAAGLALVGGLILLAERDRTSVRRLRAGH